MNRKRQVFFYQNNLILTSWCTVKMDLHAESCSFDYSLQTRVNINYAIYPERKIKKKKKKSRNSQKFTSLATFYELWNKNRNGS